MERATRVGDELEQLAIPLPELARRQRPDVQHTDDCALHDQGDAQQRANTPFSRISGLITSMAIGPGPGWSPARASRPPARRIRRADRQPESALDLLLEPLGGRATSIRPSSSTSSTAAVSDPEESR